MAANGGKRGNVSSGSVLRALRERCKLRSMSTGNARPTNDSDEFHRQQASHLGTKFER